MMRGSEGGSVFYFSKEGAHVRVEWQGSQKLVINTEKGIEFSKKDQSAFYCGDKVEVIYICKQHN